MKAKPTTRNRVRLPAHRVLRNLPGPSLMGRWVPFTRVGMRDLKSLETFYWVVTLGGFRAAAAKLNTTQPAVSARILQLEEDLGVELFDASSRRTTVTPRGKLLLSYVERMFQVRAEMLEAVADPSALTGLFRLGVSETISHTWLPELIEKISEKFPRITLDIAVDATVELQQRLVLSEIDLALMAAPLESPGATSQELCAYPYKLIVTKSRLREFQKQDIGSLLTDYPIITYPTSAVSSGALLDSLRDQLGISGVRLWGISSVHTILSMVRAGRGIGALSPVSVEAELARGGLAILDTPLQLPDMVFYSSYLAGVSVFSKESICALAHQAAQEFGRHPAAAPRRRSA